MFNLDLLRPKCLCKAKLKVRYYLTRRNFLDWLPLSKSLDGGAF